MKIPAIQYLRAIAAIAVVFDHAATLSALDKYYGQRTLLHEFLISGALGVNLFFVISGFIIVVSSFEKGTLQARKTIAGFLMARFIRILPMMWIAIVSYAALRVLGRSSEFSVTPYLNAFFLLPFGEYSPNNIWTLRHELIFYAVFGVSFLFSEKTKVNRSVFFLWIAASVFLSMIELPNEGASSLVFEIIHNVFFPGNLLFGIGAAVGAAYLRYPAIFESTSNASIKFLQQWWVLAALFAGTMWMGSVTTVNAKNLNSILESMPFYALMVIICAFSAERYSKIAYYLGSASFSIYLFHPHIESAMLGVMSKVAPALPITFVILAVSAVSVLSGCIIYSCLESPITKYLHKKLNLLVSK